MPNSIGIFKIYPESFKANVYSSKPFRMIGLIDVDVIFPDSIERVTLVYFRSSGTNSGKIQGLWYPIAGVKLKDGPFVEFTKFINIVLSNTTKDGRANSGWLAKSLFFMRPHVDGEKFIGFSNGMHYKSLLWIGERLRELYEEGKYIKDYSLVGAKINKLVTSHKTYTNNKHSQRNNFEMIIEDVFRRY